MTTHYLSTDDIEEAAGYITAGRLVVFPTETVYGLGASAVDPEAIAAIFAAKDRPTDNPLISHLSDLSAIDALLPGRTDDLVPLLERYVPGPLTLVVPAPSWAPPALSGGLDSIAVRVPENEVARRIIAEAHVPIAAPSANRSGRPSPTTFEMAVGEMDGRVAAIVDGGECRIGIESTVVDVRSAGEFSVLRPGIVTAEEIADLTGRRNIPPGDRVRHAPGTRYRHYHPGIPVYAASRDRWSEARTTLEKRYPALYITEFSTDSEFATRLYRTLWEAERGGADAVLLPDIPRDRSPGLFDRINRAADEVFR